MKDKIRIILFLVASLCPVKNPAQATTTTSTMLVSATVLSVCGVVASPLLFGNYSATDSSPTDATTSIVATCSSGVSYTLSLDAGTGSGATVATRVMTGLTGTLNYEIYKDSNHANLWGDGTASTTTQGGTAALLPQTYTVYGRIPAGQQAPAGAYTDSVTVTLTY